MPSQLTLCSMHASKGGGKVVFAVRMIEGEWRSRCRSWSPRLAEEGRHARRRAVARKGLLLTHVAMRAPAEWEHELIGARDLWMLCRRSI